MAAAISRLLVLVHLLLIVPSIALHDTSSRIHSRLRLGQQRAHHRGTSGAASHRARALAAESPDDEIAAALDQSNHRLSAFSKTGVDELRVCNSVLKAAGPRVGAHGGFTLDGLKQTMRDEGCWVYERHRLDPRLGDTVLFDRVFENKEDAPFEGSQLPEAALERRGFHAPHTLTRRKRKAIKMLERPGVLPSNQVQDRIRRIGVTRYALPELLSGEDLYMEDIEKEGEKAGTLMTVDDTVGKNAYGAKRTAAAENALPSLEAGHNLPAKEWSTPWHRWLALTRRPLTRELEAARAAGHVPSETEGLIPGFGPEKPLGAAGQCMNKVVRISTEDQGMVGSWEVHLPEFITRIKSLIGTSPLAQTADYDTLDAGRLKAIKAYWAYMCGKVHRQGMALGWPDPASIMWVPQDTSRIANLRLAVQVLYSTCMMEGDAGSTLYAWAFKRFCDPVKWA